SLTVTAATDVIDEAHIATFYDHLPPSLTEFKFLMGAFQAVPPDFGQESAPALIRALERLTVPSVFHHQMLCAESVEDVFATLALPTLVDCADPAYFDEADEVIGIAALFPPQLTSVIVTASTATVNEALVLTIYDHLPPLLVAFKFLLARDGDIGPPGFGQDSAPALSRWPPALKRLNLTRNKLHMVATPLPATLRSLNLSENPALGEAVDPEE
ncbi:hypothetical protein GGF32_005746, partial [Allomyces javanicus]